MIYIIKKLYKFKLNGRNPINGLNAWVVRVACYHARTVDWTREKLRKGPKDSWHECMITRSIVVRLYPPRREGGRGLIGIEELVEKEKKVAHAYIQEANKWMLKAASSERVLYEEKNFKDYKKRTYEQKRRI